MWHVVEHAQNSNLDRDHTFHLGQRILCRIHATRIGITFNIVDLTVDLALGRYIGHIQLIVAMSGHFHHSRTLKSP